MPNLVITLNPELYSELETASRHVCEMGFGPEKWATEAIESALASRRLPRVAVGLEALERHAPENLEQI
jgi:hypothetical protein